MKTEKTITTKTNDMVQVERSVLDDLMSRITKVESAQNDNPGDMKKPVEYPRDAPHKISYKMLLQSRDEDDEGAEILKPIAKISVKSDGVPWTNQVHQTAYITYADGSKESISYELYAKTVRYSEKQFPTEIVIKNGKKFYTFDYQGDTITVEESTIN